VKILAVLAPNRIRFLPNVATAEEQGVMKGVSVSWWATISLPAATPDAIVKKWEGAIAEMVKDASFLTATDRIKMNIDHLNAAETTAFVEKQAAYYTDMAAKIGLRK
jgi:tripartite-type tricarboxylate transporter receptor subunit TctC